MTSTHIAPRTHIPIAPANPSSGVLRPLGLDEVTITGGFWAELQSTNAWATLPHIAYWLEREGWLPNFDLAADGTLTSDIRRGREFSDSEVYKYLEALAWQLHREPDPDLESLFRETVRRVAAAQEADGYLNTNVGRPGQRSRWSDLSWGHELYCAGHLFQAAVARARTSPGSDDGLLDVAIRLADLVCETFGVDGIQSVCGHPEVETALVELGRATGEPRYIHQAQLFIDRRGSGSLPDIEWGRSYYQDDVRVRETQALHGHAVRANYLASGGVDVAIETDDAGLVRALALQWQNTTAKRTYITGGQGSHHQDEAFGVDYELPPDRAYSETCAGIASVQFSWRMLLAQGNPTYADLIERTLFNVVATSPSREGTSFFYANTLHRRVPGEPADPDVVSPRAEASLRAPWFDVACCPTNVARTLASLESYVATAGHDSLQINQYAPTSIATVLESGEHVAVTVETGYPHSGDISVYILNDADTDWTLQLRVPVWASHATVTINDETEQASAGYTSIRRRFHAGDLVRLSLPTDPRFVSPDPRIDAVRGTVAIERGPLVYALESIDLPDEWGDVSHVVLDTNEPPILLEDRVAVRLSRLTTPEVAWPYQPDETASFTQNASVTLTPYFSWAERGPSSMRIWIPTR